MRRPGMLEGAAVALAASVLGSGAYLVLAPAIGRVDALHALIDGLGLGYLVYLLVRARARAGRVAVPAAWLLVTFAAALTDATVLMHLLAQSVLSVLVRTLCFHRGVLPVLADLGIALAGLAACAWALSQGTGLALAIWSLMLVQSLFVLIPSRGVPSGAREPAGDPFEHAHRSAEAAVRRICASA